MGEVDDVTRLRAVAALVRELGLRVQVLRVGDVTLQMSEPWPGQTRPMVPVPGPVEEAPEDIDMTKLRELSRLNFGTALPDAQLRAMAPALLRSES